MASTIDKVAMFCQVETEQVVAVHDVPSTYHVPMVLEKQGLITSLTKILNLDKLEIPSKLKLRGATTWEMWKSSTSVQHHSQIVTIALVGKYTSFADSYISVIKALEHSAMFCRRKLNLVMVDSSHLEEDDGNTSSIESQKAWEILRKADGILVPGGFGTRGSEGIIDTATYTLEKNIPYLGICFGFQLAAIAFGRKMCNLENANSTEIIADTNNPIIDLLPEQKNETDMGGSLRLGANEIKINQNSLAYKIYNSDKIFKRHRHRYEFNTKYRDEFLEKGMIFSGESDDGKRMEILEIPSHKFFLGVQFHPEFNSRPGFPEDAFKTFVTAASSK